MNPDSPSRCRSAVRRGLVVRRGFTLVELLVVVGIIIVLIGILVPVVGKVRVAAQTAATKQEISQIADAIERYRMDFNSYPGPISNADFPANRSDFYNLTKITMTENMVIGILGIGGDFTSSPPTFDAETVGAGIMDRNPIRPRKVASYMADAAALLPPQPWSKFGKTGNGDKDIPEFLDRFANPNPKNSAFNGRPIVYLRANVGNGGVVADTDAKQYNTDWMKPYLMTKVYLPKLNRVFDERTEAPLTDDYPNGWSDWYQHPTLKNTPKGKDSFILVSAGPDGVFGTADDIFNVGK